VSPRRGLTDDSIDRGNPATAGPLIRDQFGLSNGEFGVLLSSR